MSEANSPNRKISLADAAPQKSHIDEWDWDRRVVPMIWFVGTEIAVRELLDHWLPSYLSVGLAVFIAGLVAISVLESRRGDYDFDRRKAYGLLVGASVAIALLHLPFDAVPSSLSLGISILLIGLVSFRFRGPRWTRYGFGKWIVFCLLISTGLSLLHFLFFGFLSKVINR